MNQNINDKKIRCQYFNAFIYSMLSLFPAAPVMIITQALKENNFDLSVFSEMLKALPVIAVMWGSVLIPCVILSLLNRFCFGRVVGNIGEKGLYVNNQFILWNDISKITFNPLFFSKLRRSYTKIIICVNSFHNKESAVVVKHFPAYGLKMIKKYNPEIKIELEKSGLFTVFILALAPTVFSVLLSLVM